MPRIIARQAYWKKYPPTHIMVRLIAIWAGAYKPADDGNKRRMTFEEFRSEFPGGLNSGQ